MPIRDLWGPTGSCFWLATEVLGRVPIPPCRIQVHYLELQSGDSSCSTGIIKAHGVLTLLLPGALKIQGKQISDFTEYQKLF